MGLFGKSKPLVDSTVEVAGLRKDVEDWVVLSRGAAEKAAAEKTKGTDEAAEKAQGKEDTAALQHPDACLMEKLENRTERYGIWFTCHESVLPEIECEEMCDIHEEFLKEHPNGGRETAGFVAVKLNQEQIKKFEDKIRISSYRWKNIKGLGPKDAKGEQKWGIPELDTYKHFLERARDRKQLIWMDWMSHDGVNAPKHSTKLDSGEAVLGTLDYMGDLYAENIVLGEWMLKLDKLPEALSRIWIFQEMAYGPMDKEAMAGLFEELRERGRAVAKIPWAKEPKSKADPGEEFKKNGTRRNNAEDVQALKKYVLGCGCIASLLTRRGFGTVAKDCKWFQDIMSHTPELETEPDPVGSLQLLGFDSEPRIDGFKNMTNGGEVAARVIREAEAGVLGTDLFSDEKAGRQVGLLGIDQEIFAKVLLLFSTQKGQHARHRDAEKAKAPWPHSFDWEDGQWDTCKQELLELVCTPPYTVCKNLDELLQMYSKGIIGSALGCQSTVETDRPIAVSTVFQSIASKRFSTDLNRRADQASEERWNATGAEVMRLCWNSLLCKFEQQAHAHSSSLVVAKVQAPITAFSSSFILEPLQLEGTLIRFEQQERKKGNWETTLKYIDNNNSVAKHRAGFSEINSSWMDPVTSLVSASGFRGMATVDLRNGEFDGQVCDKPVPGTTAEGKFYGPVADICFCVPGANASIAKKTCMFTILTQPKNEDNRVISFQAWRPSDDPPSQAWAAPWAAPKNDVQFHKGTQ